ncbi:hypothetical protein GGR52DRAFT_566389 [Hypoxylon sp. FL1284]|nr:hypothetical protein GGR52DRAFT_566389 [Hypoxylon sp. FL1284]
MKLEIPLYVYVIFLFLLDRLRGMFLRAQHAPSAWKVSADDTPFSHSAEDDGIDLVQLLASLGVPAALLRALSLAM